MFIFRGLREFLQYKKRKLPMRLFRKWLWCRWKYDLKWVMVSPIAVPSILFFAISQLFEAIAEILASLVPDVLKPNDKDMVDIVAEAKEWEKRNKNENIS